MAKLNTPIPSFKRSGTTISPRTAGDTVDLGTSVVKGNLLGTNVLQVGTGCEYTTISAAMSAASAGDTILVAPGTYTETITFAANNITIIGLGKPNSVVVTQADANVVDFSTFTGLQIKNMKLQVTAATSAIATVTGSTGLLNVKECQTSMTTTANIATAAQPSVGEVTGAGTLKFTFGKFTYANSGNGGGTAQKAAFRVGTGGVIHLGLVKDSTIVTSGTELATSVAIDTNSTGIVKMYENEITITGTGSLVAGLAYLGGTGTENEFRRNTIEIDATGCTNAYGFYAADAASTSRFFYNHIHVENATNNYSFLVAASATVVSHFDDIVAADGASIAGTFSEVSSENDGDLSVSDQVFADKVDEYTAGAGVTADGVLLKDATATLGTASSIDGAMILQNATNANTTTIQSGVAAASVTYTLPTNVGGAGSQLTDAAGDGVLSWASSGAGANAALSNLASVAINDTLVSDTDNTDALGTAAIAWSDLFLGNESVITWSTAPSTPDVTLTHSANLLTLAGGNLALGANNLTMTGSIADTTNRVTKGWFTDLECTNAIAGSITGNAATVTSFTPASGSLTLSGADALTLTTTNTTDVTLPTTGTLATLAGAETLTNKSITPRVWTAASDATPDVNADDYDAVTITALAANITDVNMSGTPVNFQKLVFRILDNGTARDITWGSDFQAMGVALPTTTTASKVLTVGFIYDTVDSKWGCVASVEEA